MRFLIGQFSHESNSFCTPTTGEDDFKRWELTRGDEIIQAHLGKHTVLGGMIDVLAKSGHVLIGSVSAMAAPSGPIDVAFYQRIKADLLDAIRKAGELDGILLSLHGAMSVEEIAGIYDPEGDLVAGIRTAVGPSVPVAAIFDLHSDMSDLLLDNANLTLAYNEEPHRDAYERGQEAAELIQRIRRGEIQPVTARERVPMLLPAINMATDQGPMYSLHQMRAELEKIPDVIDISLHPGFYGADQPDVGFSVVCTTDRDPALARDLARKIARAAWEIREQFLVDLTPIPEAVAQALANPEPVGLIDEADDPAGGAPSDSVEVLRGMLSGGVRYGGVSTIKDTQVARQMAQLGEGRRLSTLLGAKTDALHGKPVEVEGRIVKIHRGPIPLDTWSGRVFELGIIGVLDVNGILVVVTEQKVVAENYDIFEILGFDVSKMQVAAFKGLGLHIRQALTGKINSFIPVDGVGVTHPDVRKLGPYRHLRRPIWPLDAAPVSPVSP